MSEMGEYGQTQGWNGQPEQSRAEQQHGFTHLPALVHHLSHSHAAQKPVWPPIDGLRVKVDPRLHLRLPQPQLHR